MSVKLAHSVDYWDTDAHSIGEDMHMYLKCFFSTQGHLKVITIYSPASQCNVQADNYFSGLTERYVQAKRHMWGSLDSGYMYRRIIFGILAPGYDSTTQGVSKKVPLVRPPKYANDETASRLIKLLPVLLHRMIEAHIVGGQVMGMVLVLSFLPVTSTHPYVVMANWVGFWFRNIFGVTFVMMVYQYEKYHQYCSVDRWELSMREQLNPGSGEGVQPLGKRSQLQSPARTYMNMFDWLCLPFSGFFFLTLPQLHSHFIHLFTDQLDYSVAGKPVYMQILPESNLFSPTYENYLVTKSISNNSLSTESDTSSRGDSGFYEFDNVVGKPLSPSMFKNSIDDFF
jgi:hypothetical protein